MIAAAILIAAPLWCCAVRGAVDFIEDAIAWHDLRRWGGR